MPVVGRSNAKKSSTNLRDLGEFERPLYPSEGGDELNSGVDGVALPTQPAQGLEGVPLVGRFAVDDSAQGDHCVRTFKSLNR